MKLKNYFVVTSSYWAFTLTDGALRMLVLLHFFKIGFSPFTLALIFVLYEVMGIFANLFGGWFSVKFGITRILTIGISLQIVGLIFLSLLNTNWTIEFSIFWILIAQGISGVAKDLTKTASKSAIKITASNFQSQLFKLVALFTGSKNTMKGIGFFLGGILLELLGFKISLWLMALCLFLILLLSFSFLPKKLGKSSPSKSFRELFSKSKNINMLSLARVFLFGARDVWFVVGLPVFLYSNKWEFWQVGSFLAIWTIAYGIIQSIAPKISGTSRDGLTNELYASKIWIFILTIIPLLLLIYIFIFNPQNYNFVISVILTLSIFGIPFAVNSSLHSYLILAYSNNKTAEDVGFYYAANATGRLIGTIMSGYLYQLGGITVCILGSGLMLIFCLFFTMLINNKTYN